MSALPVLQPPAPAAAGPVATSGPVEESPWVPQTVHTEGWNLGYDMGHTAGYGAGRLAAQTSERELLRDEVSQAYQRGLAAGKAEGLAEARLAHARDTNAAAADVHKTAWVGGQHSAMAAGIEADEAATMARERDAFLRGLERGHADAVRYGWNQACAFHRLPTYEVSAAAAHPGTAATVPNVQAVARWAGAGAGAAAGPAITPAGHPASLWDTVPGQ